MFLSLRKEKSLAIAHSVNLIDHIQLKVTLQIQPPDGEEPYAVRYNRLIL